MKKTTFILSLQRTILGKTGTNDNFISGKNIMERIFGITKDSLPNQTQRTIKTIRPYKRDPYCNTANPKYTYEELEVSIASNNELRWGNFKKILEDLACTETDYLVVDKIIRDTGETYHIGVKFNYNKLVLAKPKPLKYKKCKDLTLGKDKPTDVVMEWKGLPGFYVWDYYASEADKNDKKLSYEIWSDYLNRQIPGYYIDSGQREKATFYIQMVGQAFIECGAKGSGAQRRPIYKDKPNPIYTIIGYKKNQHKPLALNEDLYNITKINGKLIVEKRNNILHIVDVFIKEMED